MLETLMVHLQLWEPKHSLCGFTGCVLATPPSSCKGVFPTPGLPSLLKEEVAQGEKTEPRCIRRVCKRGLVIIFLDIKGAVFEFRPIAKTTLLSCGSLVASEVWLRWRVAVS